MKKVARMSLRWQVAIETEPRRARGLVDRRRSRHYDLLGPCVAI